MGSGTPHNQPAQAEDHQALGEHDGQRPVLKESGGCQRSLKGEVRHALLDLMYKYSEVGTLTVIVPEATLVYIRGWMQMAFYYHIIYSPETNNQGKTSDYIYIRYIQQDNGCYFMTLHTLCMMSYWCHIGPILLSYWFPHGRLASSTVADQLLILFSTGWVGPPLCPSPHGDPCSLRVHAHAHLSIYYSYSMIAITLRYVLVLL